MPSDSETVDSHRRAVHTAAFGGMANVSPGDVKIRLRSSKRQSLTKTLKSLEQKFPDTLEQILFYKSKLKKLESELSSLDNDIELLMLSSGVWDDNELETQSSVKEQYSDDLTLALIKLNDAEAGFNLNGSQPSVPNSQTPGPATRPKLKLPDIELPKFDSNPENYFKFISDLEKILDKFDLTQYEKFSYLKNHVSGSARDIVDSIPIGDRNYDDAKKLLHDAYANKTTQQFSVIEKFLKLNSVSCSNMYSWVSEARILTDQIGKFDISGEIFAQYFIWNSLSDVYKQQFIAITNKTKPELKEIMDCAFEVINRMKDSPNLVNSSRTITLATNVDYHKNKSDSKLNSKTCWLCQKLGISGYDGHRIYNCPKFSDAESRKSKISELHGCTRCGYLNHQMGNCKFKFSGKCKTCNKYHAYFLCTAKPKSTNSEPDGLNASVITVSSNVSDSSTLVVPTFTAKFVDNSRSCEARVLYDPASQYSFVSEHIIAKLPHKLVEDNVIINISGFNQSKKIKTKIVELSARLTNQTVKFNAAVVPKINAKLTNPHLSKISKMFSSKNVVLADSKLGQNSFVDVLLGVNGSANFSVHSLHIGGPKSKCQVYSSPAGVMMAGDVQPLLVSSNYNAIKTFLTKIEAIE